MAVEARRLPVEILAAAAVEAAEAPDLRSALGAIAGAVRLAAEADAAVLRVVDEDGLLVARAVAPAGSPLGAELAGSRAGGEPEADGTPVGPTARAAERIGAAGALSVPARSAGRLVGSVELVRVVREFGPDEHAVAGLAAAQLALAVRTHGGGGSRALPHRRLLLELAGNALSAGGDPERTAQQVLKVALDATGARGGVLWLLDDAAEPRPAASAGLPDTDPPDPSALDAWPPELVDTADGGRAVTVALGRPPLGALRLLYTAETAPDEDGLAALGAFAARAALALRQGERSQEAQLELDRTRALLEVVGEAISRLSLAHTLSTAVERIGDLLQIERVGVYLRAGDRLESAAGRGLYDGHEAVAAELLEQALGPLRARAAVHADVAGRERALAAVRSALRAAGQESALAVPLQALDETIGLLVAYPDGRALSPGEVALFVSLAAQLAVAVQNARLHEQTRQLAEERSTALTAAEDAYRRLDAVAAISRSFADDLSLEGTLSALTAKMVEVLGVHAAVIRTPDDRGDQFVPRAVHVAESGLADAVRAILERPQPRPSRTPRATLLDVETARRLGGAHALLVPFLEKGSTAALVPIVRSELLAQLTILSLDPAAPIDESVVASAQTLAQQAALAIDNARLYDHQRQFAETMQRSLLPRELPEVAGIEIGAVYESAAQVDVGGDVFDFLELADGRLSVVLGDVTGHGIEATADMAMAKFVFRSLAREHSEPAAFLSRANEVVVGEIAVGKFITMASVVVDPAGEVLCASAGHPEPRVVRPDGGVEPVPCGGLALGVDAPQAYEQTRAELPPGAAVVLYTDGVIEARRDGELYGVRRLDAVLAANAGRPAQELAEAVLASCREFAGAALADDCAVVVIRRS